MSGTNSTNGQPFPAIDSFGFGNITIQPGVATIAGFKMAPIVLRSVPPTSGSYNMGGGSVAIGPNNLIGRYIDPQHGTVTLWIDFTHGRIRLNSSQVPANSVSIPLPTLHTQSFWGKVGVVLAVVTIALLLPALFGAAVAAAVPGAIVAIITADMLTQLMGFTVAAATLAAGLLDANGCNPYCSPQQFDDVNPSIDPYQNPPELQ